MGGGGNARAESYNLLLQEERAILERHKGSEKAPGMFDTLVVALPSSHQGGDVEISFGNRKQTLSIRPMSNFRFSYPAWYSDIERAVLPVTLGYRQVLAHLTAQEEPQLAANLGNDKAKLCKALSLWAHFNKDANSQAPTILAYLPDQEYTEASLRLDKFRGKDQHKVQLLEQTCEGRIFFIFLARL